MMPWIKRNWWKFFLAMVLLLVVVWLGVELAFRFTYSDSNVVGRITKFGRKGWVFKTYEGVLDQGGFRNQQNSGGGSNIAAYMWDFTAIDGKAIKEIDACQGHAIVRLHYRQRAISLPWYGEQSYIVDRCEVVERAKGDESNFSHVVDNPPPIR